MEVKFHNGLYFVDKENMLGKGSYGAVNCGKGLKL